MKIYDNLNNILSVFIEKELFHRLTGVLVNESLILYEISFKSLTSLLKKRFNCSLRECFRIV